jgi:hypothetical protein
MMEDPVKFKTVNIKTLSRSELEAAFLDLHKVSLMKTQLIKFLETTKRESKDD